MLCVSNKLQHLLEHQVHLLVQTSCSLQGGMDTSPMHGHLGPVHQVSDKITESRLLQSSKAHVLKGLAAGTGLSLWHVQI